MVSIDVRYKSGETETFFPHRGYSLHENYIKFARNINNKVSELVIPFSNVLFIEIENEEEK